MHGLTHRCLLLVLGLVATGCQGIVDQMGQPGIRELGPEGGTITVENLTVELSEGALSESTMIVVEQAEESWVPTDHQGPAYRLGPPGTMFDAPVLLTFTLTEEETLEMGNYPDGIYVSKVKGARWVPLLTTTVDAESHTVSAVIHHFSLFGLWMKPSGICSMEVCENRRDDDCDGITDDDCYDPERCDGLIDEDGICADCEPDCVGIECGGDGCGGSCGACPDDEVCVQGECVSSTLP